MTTPPNERKIDLTNIPRGAIGPRGMPVSRNARLPSIRTPRDLTLGTQPKRTFVPNIPVRREKRSQDSGKDDGNTSTENNARRDSKVFTPKNPERGRGRGRNRGQIIQTEGSVFGDGIAASAPKGRQKESTPRTSFSSGRGSAVKREKAEISMADISRDMDNLMRDDFIDDGDDDKLEGKPIMFPPSENKKDIKVKIKTENMTENMDTKENFSNQDFAKDMGFDVKRIAKFIKKEKTDEDHVKPPAVDAVPDLPKSEIAELLTSNNSQLILLRFPKCITAQLPEYQQKGQTSVEAPPPKETKDSSGDLSSLPEGHIGKLQLLKSGHTRLVIGALHYDLDSITSLKSKHEVASIHAESDSGDIVLLGNVKETLSFAPDIGSVLS